MNTITTIMAASLAAVLAVSMIATPAYASWASIQDEEGDFTGLAPDFNADFDIESAGITSDGNLRMTMYGAPGGTIPDNHHLVYGYVFVTDVGLVAITSHAAEDSAQVEDDTEWHSHLVELDGDGCVTSLQDFGKAIVNPAGVQSLQTGATTLDAVLTAQLTIDHGADHDDHSDDTVCVTGVWDIAPNP